MRARLLWLALAGTVAALSGCGGPAAPVAAPVPSPAPSRPSPSRPSSDAASFPMTVRDDAGRQVTLPTSPRRIVSLAAGHTETLYALGAGDRVVAADKFSDYPAEVRPKATLNCWPKPPLEEIVALKPDLVVVFTEGPEFLQQAEAVKVPVLKLFPQSYAQVLDEIELLGRITGRASQAHALVTRMKAESEAVQAIVRSAPKPRLLFELDATDPAKPYVAGSGGFYGEILSMAGAQNVFAEIQAPSDAVSAEQIIARNPEVILLGDAGSPQQPQSPQTVAARPGWSTIAAVQSHRIYPVNTEQLTRPGPRLVDGLDQVVRLLHGNLIK